MRAKYRFYKNKLALSPTKNRYENFVNSRKKSDIDAYLEVLSSFN